MNTTHLFSPITFRDLTIKNRIVVSPMCQYSSVDGFSNSWHLVHLGTRAIGGAGLVFTEATAITPEGRISPDDLGLWSDDHIEHLSQITAFISEHGAVPGIQLAHAGRKASQSSPWKGNTMLFPEQNGWNVVGPSPIPFSNHYPTPTALSIDEIHTIKEAFILAAKRALRANFKVVEIHSAHGYLLHEFLSPLSNQRQDQYGGSFENRTRLLLEIVQAVREIWPSFLPVFVRISASDWTEKGWTIEDSIALSKLLKLHGVDLVDCSSGGNVASANMPLGPGYQTQFAERIKHESQIATGAVGLITSAIQADHIIRTHQADMVFLARELLRNPYWPLEAALELGHDITWPNQYLRAKWASSR